MKYFVFFLFVTLNLAHSQVSKVDWFRKSGEDTARVSPYGIGAKFLTFPDGSVMTTGTGANAWTHTILGNRQLLYPSDMSDSVLIGTPTPLAKFTVSGTANVSGPATLQTNLLVGSGMLDSMLTVQQGGHFMRGMKVDGEIRAGAITGSGTLSLNSASVATSILGVKGTNAKAALQTWERSASSAPVASIDTNGTTIFNNTANNASRFFWDATSNGGAGVLSLSYISTDKVYQKGTDLQVGSGITNGSTYIVSGTTSFASIQFGSSGTSFTSTGYIGVKANNSRPNIQEWYRSTSSTAVAAIDTMGRFSTLASITTKGLAGTPVVLDTIVRTTQTMSVAPTNFSNASTTGFYEVTFYIFTTTAGSSGTVTFDVIANDGTSSKATSSATVDLTSTAIVGMKQGTVIIRLGAGSVQWGTTVSGATGNPIYSVYATCKRIS